jgi:hypothetical protein
LAENQTCASQLAVLVVLTAGVHDTGVLEKKYTNTPVCILFFETTITSQPIVINEQEKYQKTSQMSYQ